MSWLCRPGIVWEPIREMSSHTTHQGTLVLSWLGSLSQTDPGLESVISVCELISTLNKQTKNVGGQWLVKPSLKSSCARKKPLPPPQWQTCTCKRAVIFRAKKGEICFAWCKPKSFKSASSVTPHTWVSSSCNQSINNSVSSGSQQASN